MGRQTDSVTAPPQLQDEPEYGADAVRVQPHLRFFDHHPLEVFATLHLRRGHEPVESQQQRDEFALPG